MLRLSCTFFTFVNLKKKLALKDITAIQAFLPAAL